MGRDPSLGARVSEHAFVKAGVSLASRISPSERDNGGGVGSWFLQGPGRLVNAGDAKPSWLRSWAHLALLFSAPHWSPTIGGSWKRYPRTTVLLLAGTLGTTVQPGRAGASLLPRFASVLTLTGICQFPKACL